MLLSLFRNTQLDRFGRAQLTVVLDERPRNRLAANTCAGRSCQRPLSRERDSRVVAWAGSGNVVNDICILILGMALSRGVIVRHRCAIGRPACRAAVTRIWRAVSRDSWLAEAGPLCFRRCGGKTEARLGFLALPRGGEAHWRTLSRTPRACRKFRGSTMLKSAIDGHPSDPDRATVVNTVAVARSRFNRAQQAGSVNCSKQKVNQ